MTTSTERQRRRRQRLREQGFVDVTVSVPRQRRHAVRKFARSLQDEAPPIAGGDHLRNAIRALKSMRPRLRAAGVTRAGVFGSTARGDVGPDSDIDIVLELDVNKVGGILKYIKICESIKAEVMAVCPGVSVDVADHGAMKPRVRAAAERDAIYAF